MVVNFASLFHDPFQIPDRDLLLLHDRSKCVIHAIFYLVCDGMNGLKVYNSKWGLVKNIAKHWQRTLEEVRFSSAIALPYQNVLSADYKNNWVTEHTAWGMSVGHRIEKVNFQPMYLTFHTHIYGYLNMEINLTGTNSTKIEPSSTASIQFITSTLG